MYCEVNDFETMMPRFIRGRHSQINKSPSVSTGEHKALSVKPEIMAD